MSFRVEAVFSHSSLNVRGMVVHIVNKLIETSDEDSNSGKRVSPYKEKDTNPIPLRKVILLYFWP